MNAVCFRCQAKYKSDDPDDIAGDGKCGECKRISAEVAFKVDMDMAKKRMYTLASVSRIRQLFTEEQILKGEVAGSGPQVNIKDLGITPND